MLRRKRRVFLPPPGRQVPQHHLVSLATKSRVPNTRACAAGDRRPRQAAWLGPTGQQAAHYAKHAAPTTPTTRPPFRALRAAEETRAKARRRRGGTAPAAPGANTAQERSAAADAPPPSPVRRKQGTTGKQKGPHVAQPACLHKLQHGVQEFAQ